MRVETKKIYITDDGKQFTNETDAMLHEKVLNETRYFFVEYAADVEEGEKPDGLTENGFISVQALGDHALFADHYLQTNLGNRVEIGADGNPYLIWTYVPADRVDALKGNLLQEIYGPGI